MRQAEIYINDILAGRLWEDEEGYHFEYATAFLKSSRPESVSLTLPFREEPYHSAHLFPFFDGLIPEGWLLQVVENNWKISSRDRMGLLLATCRDCIGNISVMPL